MGIALANTVPVTIDGGGVLAPFWGPFQSIELHDFQSLPGASYLAPAHRNFTAVGGIPPGLSVASADGVVSGTISTCTSAGAITDAVDGFPSTPISLAGYITEVCTVMPATYILGDIVEVIYDFGLVTIMGIWDMPTPGGPVPIPVTKVFSIKILKNWQGDIDAY